MNKFRIALVGCGRISPIHVAAFRELPDSLDFVGACDVIEERAKTAVGNTGASPFTEYAKMLDQAKPDIVTVCTPSGMHPEMGIKAAEHGAHVVSEKPLGCSLKAVDKFIQTADKQGVRLFCVKQNRYNATAQLLKRAVDKGRFGRIYLAQVNVFWRREQSYYDSDLWRGTWALDGGAFMNQACHLVDMLVWLVGDVESVSAITGTLARKMEAEDTGCAALKFQNGAIGNINVTMLAHPTDIEGSITILGEKGSVTLGGVAVNRIDRWEFADHDEDDALVKKSNYVPRNMYGFGHLAYYHNVIDVLNGKGEPNPDGRGGRKSLETILAIYKSSREGRRIALPLDE